jgi:hypothetical protein
MLAARLTLLIGVLIWATGCILWALGGGVLPWLLAWVGAGVIFLAFNAARPRRPRP